MVVTARSCNLTRKERNQFDVIFVTAGKSYKTSLDLRASIILNSMRPLLHQFDYRITTLIQLWPEWVRPFMVGATIIGHPIVTVAIGCMVLFWGWYKSNTSLLLSGLVVIATFYLGALMKLLLHRDRPLTEYVAQMHFETFSFPSGHSTGSMVAYGLLAYVAWQIAPSPWNYIAVAIGVGIILLVGLSRIYLGAHFPSDVVAGWLLGALGLFVIIFVIQPKL